LLKILFPDKAPTDEEFYKYCVNPALELRLRVRDELCKLDREYAPVTFISKLPDDFQRNHRLVRYVTEQEAEVPLDLLGSSEAIRSVDKEEAEISAFFGEKEVSVKAAEENLHHLGTSIINQAEALSEEEKLIR